MKKLIPILLLILYSCGNKSEEWCTTRDNHVKVVVTPIDGGLPAIHAFSGITVCDDILLIHDYTSTDRQFLAYDILNDRYLGSFGTYGNGPGEIINFGCVFYNPVDHIVYGVNGNKWEISGFNLDSAVIDPDIKAFKKVELNSSGGRFPINNATYLNDSTVICTLYMPNKDNTKICTYLAVCDLTTGITRSIDSVEPKWKVRNQIAVSARDSLIVATDSNRDRIRLYDLDGNLKKAIYGPDYIEQGNRGNSYYASPVIVGNRIYVVYSGKDLMEQRCGKEIIVMDLDGKYLETLCPDIEISSIDYHEKTGRLYMSLEGDIQFGYIQLN